VISMRLKALLALAFLVPWASPVQAQGWDSGDGFRIGVYAGGISTFGVTAEFFWDSHAAEIGLGTWSFKDVSLSAVYKEYIGDWAVRPFAGAGLWTVIAAPALEGERTGAALVLRVPLGVDWSFIDDHAVGLAVNLNRGLVVRRSDPMDDLPMNRRLVPLPEVYYRLTP